MGCRMSLHSREGGRQDANIECYIWLMVKTWKSRKIKKRNEDDKRLLKGIGFFTWESRN